MAEYFTGTPRQLEELAAQATHLFEEHNYAVIVGSVGRQAMYAHYDYEGADPLPLLRPPGEGPWYASDRRDIDVVMPFGVSAKTHQLNRSGAYPIDTRSHHFHWRGGTHTIMAGGNPVPVDPAVLERKVSVVPIGDREVQVQTFSVGTQFYLDGLYRLPGIVQPQDRRARARQIFGEFARRVFLENPEEFLPDEAYEPFRQANPNIGPPPWIDLATLKPPTVVEPTREQIVVRDPASRASEASIAEVLQQVNAVRERVFGNDESALGDIVSATESLLSAIDTLHPVMEDGDSPLSEAITWLLLAREAAIAATEALQTANTNLQIYEGQVTGAGEPPLDEYL